MKKIYLLIGLALPGVAYFGQEADFKLNDLYIPSSPGLILGDKAPASIERPTTPRAFGVSVLNFIKGGAMEVTPFWLTNKPDYTFDDWVNKKFMAVESFNISVASFKENDGYGVAPGIRSQLFRTFTPKSKKSIADKHEHIIELLTATDTSGNLVLDEKAIHQAQDELEQLMAKGIFSVDLAGAMVSTSSSNTFKELSAQKYGAWVNASYIPNKFPLAFTALARYSWTSGNTVAVADTSKLDFGASLSFQKEKFDIAFEYISRSDFSNQKHSDRFALVCNYVYSENIVLVTSFGKNFSDTDNIITTLGLKFGIARERKSLGSE